MELEERIRRYLAKCPPAISGSDGSGATFAVACALVNGFTLDREAAMRWMLVYNVTCVPSWNPRDLRHKVDDAIKEPHDKPRGYLLGNSRDNQGPRLKGKFEPVAVPLKAKSGIGKPKNSSFGTVGTVTSDIHAHTHMQVCVCAHTHTCDEYLTEPSQPSQVVAETNRETQKLEEGPSQPSQREEKSFAPAPEAAAGWPSLILVPDCKVGRPPEIEMDDAEWHKLDASGFASEPLVQLAAWMFGPGCTVLNETKEKAL